MPSQKLFLFGPPHLERDGVPVKLDTRKNVALVAYLAVTSETHGRETLITLLWPELEPSRARAILRRNLSVLKKALNGEWLVVDRESVGADPDADFWLDVDQFRALLATPQEHDHPEDNTCPACLDALAEAVELYHGDFMAGFGLRDSIAFGEWQFFQGEVLVHPGKTRYNRLIRCPPRPNRAAGQKPGFCATRGCPKPGFLYLTSRKVQQYQRQIDCILGFCHPAPIAQTSPIVRAG